MNERLLFDEKLVRRFREAIQLAFADVPELRSVVVVFDFFGPYNDVEGVKKGVWLASDGDDPKPLDSVAGSLGVMLQSSTQVLDELMQRSMAVKQELTEASAKLLKIRQETEKANVERPGSA